jgi:hypothetical protein
MPSLNDYFQNNSYKAKFLIGDRVTGKWNKIPFVGTVLVEHRLNEDDGPNVKIYLDLPIKFKNTWHNIIKLKPSECKYFK